MNTTSDDRWAQMALRVMLWRIAKVIEAEAAAVALRIRTEL